MHSLPLLIIFVFRILLQVVKHRTLVSWLLLLRVLLLLTCCSRLPLVVFVCVQHVIDVALVLVLLLVGEVKAIVLVIPIPS